MSNQATKSLRDKIRSATVGAASQFKREEVKFGGIEVEIRQPSVKVRRELYSKCSDDSGKIDILDFMTWGVIYNTYVPGTNEHVFDSSDYDAMVEKPAGGFLDQFGEVVSRLMNVEDVEGKNSES